MTIRDGGPVRLLAGTSAGERRPAIHPGPEREWHLPAHARDPAAVRERMSAQVGAGADVLLAHTFLTHRRALARVGEARRARELTRAAVVLSREAAEQGQDRRDQAASSSRNPVAVAGVVPALGEDTGSGRLGSMDAASARDLHDHAGLLAEAGVDLIVVEAEGTPAATAAAVAAVRSMGIETWVVVAPEGLDLAEGHPAGPDAILLRVPAGASVERVTEGPPATDVPWGVMFDSPVSDPAGDPTRDPAADVARAPGEELSRLLTAGAALLGISDGATPERIAILRAAIGTHEQGRSAARETEAAAWLAWVAEGATHAPSGPALWLSASPPGELPQGWDWSVLRESELPLLPDERYRLVVCPTPGLAAAALGRVLEPGGVLVAVAQGFGPAGEPLRLLERRDVDGAIWFIGRRR